MCAHQQLLQNYNLKDCPYLDRATNFNNFHLSARHGDGLMVRHLQFEVEHCGLCDLGQCSQSLWVSISSSQWGLITFPISISIRIFTASLVKHFTGKDTKPKEVSGYVQDEAQVTQYVTLLTVSPWTIWVILQKVTLFSCPFWRIMSGSEALRAQVTQAWDIL